MAGDRQGLVEAEQRLFARLALQHRSRQVALDAAPVGQARVLEVGDGAPILFLHGAGMSAAVWAPLFAHLPGRRCIAVDLPGCGLTDGFDYRGVDLRAHGRGFLAAVLAALDLDRVPVVANSLGSTFGLYLAAEQPGRFSHLVLFGAPGVALPGGRGNLAMSLYSRPALGRLVSALSPPIRPPLARRMLVGICGRAAVDAMPDEMFEVVAATVRIAEPTTRTLMPELFAGATPRPHHVLSDEELVGITTPARFVWGRDDRFQPPSAAARAIEVMPDAGLVETAGGHHPWWDDATGSARLVEGFLDA